MRYFLAICFLLVAIGCASTPDDPNAPRPRRPRDIKLEVGMTKDDVREKYGDPNSITQTSNGEQWYYDNRGEAYIPFHFGYRYKFRSFLFGSDGRLKAFHVDDF
jgi:outer membrane protein assembly factor BamE (lipoprotein component of BamABCDE complex)